MGDHAFVQCSRVWPAGIAMARQHEAPIQKLGPMQITFAGIEVRVERRELEALEKLAERDFLAAHNPARLGRGVGLGRGGGFQDHDRPIGAEGVAMPQLRAVLIMREELMADMQRAARDDDTGKGSAAIGASAG